MISKNTAYTKKSNYKFDIEKMMPFLCVMSAFKTFTSYYRFIAPSLNSFWTLLYNAITLFLLVAYVPLFFMLLANGRYKNRNLFPAIIIPLTVCFNILLAGIEAGGILDVLSRSYRIPNAVDTNDEFGYYFSQINVWFGNMSLIAILATCIKKKRTIVKCITGCMAVMVIPILIIMITHPSAIGVRQSNFEEQAITFGGGLWNIGVIGFGSLSWLGLAMLDNSTKNEKRFIIFSVALFAFVGVAGISRTIVLMAIFSFVYYFLASKKSVNFVIKTLMVIFLLIIVIVIEGDLINTLIERFTGEDSGANNVRFELWRVYLSHIKEYWLFGTPLGNVYCYYLETDLLGEHYLPHSAIINFWVRFGVFATLAYLALVKNSFFRKNKGNNRSVYIKAGGIAYITLAFINQTGYAETIFYVMFGLLLAYDKIIRAEQADENRDNH